MIQPQELKELIYSNISDEIAWLSATMFWDFQKPGTWIIESDVQYKKKTITYWILKQVNHLIELLKLTLNNHFVITNMIYWITLLLNSLSSLSVPCQSVLHANKSQQYLI